MGGGGGGQARELAAGSQCKLSIRLYCKHPSTTGTGTACMHDVDMHVHPRVYRFNETLRSSGTYSGEIWYGELTPLDDILHETAGCFR